MARTFARFFAAANEPFIFVSRAPEQNQQTYTYQNLPNNISRVLIAVPDDAIPTVAALLSSANPEIALHTSGNLAAGALSPLSEQGTACGVIHPLQTLAGSPDDLASLLGAAFAVSGDPAALAWARTIVDGIGGELLQISPEHKSVYHAAAVMLSNYVTALIDAGEFLFNQAGIPADTARRIAAPLLRRAVENTLERGPAAALTGPIARGDRHTVAAHLQALSVLPPTIEHLYRAAGLHTLDLAGRKGLPPQAAQPLLALLNNNRN